MLCVVDFAQRHYLKCKHSRVSLWRISSGAETSTKGFTMAHSLFNSIDSLNATEKDRTNTSRICDHSWHTLYVYTITHLLVASITTSYKAAKPQSLSCRHILFVRRTCAY
jgi:hypothetical protein